MRGIKFKTIPVSSMRKLALGAWGKPSDPSTNVQVDLDVTELVNFIDKKNGISLKQALIKLFSNVLWDVPKLNTILIRHKFRQRLNNRIFIPTILRYNRQIDLNGIFIDDAHAMTFNQLRECWKQKILNLRSGTDPETSRVLFIFKWLPSLICKPVIKLLDFIQYTCNISLKWLGLPNDPFGTMTVTFLDSFNIKYANIPIYSFSRSSICAAVGKLYIENGKKMLPITWTFDHRCFDGFEGHAGLKRMNYYLKNPDQLDR